MHDTNVASGSGDPGASQIKVRVYGQQYDNTTATLVGNSFLIGETALGSIPGFNSPNNQGTLPNWTMASVPFKLSEHPETHAGGIYLAFWAVVWMENNAGGLVAEIPDHGLTANPENMAFTSITAVPFESHSNNAGLYGYKSPFYVCPLPPSPCATASGAPGGAIEAIDDRVSVIGVEVPAMPLFVDNRTVVMAQLLSHDFTGPLAVAFFDGDPAHGGQLFDVHHISNIRANDTYITKGYYRPQTCGRHTLYVMARPEHEAPETGSVDVDVTIDPDAAIGILRTKLAGFRLGAAANPLLQDLAQAEKQFAKGNTFVGANHLRVFSQHVNNARHARIPGFEPAFFAGLAGLTADCVLAGQHRPGSGHAHPRSRRRPFMR